MSPSERPVRLTAHAEDENTRIDVLDGDLNVIPGSSRLGETTVDVPPGAYAVRFQIGSEYVQRVAILTPQSAETHVWLKDADAPRFATSAPVRQTTSTREIHRAPAQRLSLAPPLPVPAAVPDEGRLLVFARDLVEGRRNDPAEGLSLHDPAGTMVADFGTVGERDLEDRWAGAHLQLKAGPYRLRLSSVNRRFSEQIIYVVKGWQTQVFLLAGGAGESDRQRRVNLAGASVLMARPKEGFTPERPDLRWTESALRALGESGNIPGAVRSEMMWEKFQNPMLGIYAGILHLRREKVDPHLLRTVFHNLMGLVGPLPDVLAIGWALALRVAKTTENELFMQGLHRPGDLSMPPMLRASWDELVEASVLHPQLVPAGSFTERASTALTRGGPWFSWRGEPPAVPKEVAPPRATGLWAAGAGLLEAFAGGALGFALQTIAKTLAQMPMAGYLLYSHRFTDLERRVAQYAYPLVDLQLQKLIEGDEALTAEVLEGLKSRGIDAAGLVKSLKIPASTALGAVWGLLRKLVIQPVVPHGKMLASFVAAEAHQNEILVSLLKSLEHQATPLRNKRGGEPVSALAFLMLRYRGSPSESVRKVADTKHLAKLLQENEYVIGEEAAAPDARGLDRILAELRAHVLAELKQEVAKRNVKFGRGWHKQVLPKPAAYKTGALLPAPVERQAARRLGEPAGL